MTDSTQAHQLDERDRPDHQICPGTGHDDSWTSPIDEYGQRITAPLTVATRDCAVDGAAPRLGTDESCAAGNNVVVTIGIDGYTAWPHLGNAVSDARGTSEAFRRLGFREARSLTNETATGDAIRQLVTDDLSTLGVNDSLVIFFAGHGGTTTRVLQDGTTIKTGYIIPVDAENNGQVASWIRLDSWLDDIARLPPNHILVILDACHSGIALDALVKWRDINTWQSDSADELSRRRSRRVIVSALDDQLALDGGPVVGHSLFTGCLIQALSGGLPRDGRQTATGTELGLHLQRRVKEYPNSRQTPDFGAFELDDRGELLIPLFPLTLDPGTPSPAAGADTHAALRRKLAVTLAGLVSSPAVIAQLVAEHAPMIGITELPADIGATIWMYVLVELTNRNLFAEMAAVIDAARRRSRRSRRVDWASFDPVLLPAAVPAVASWSHLGLELRRDDSDKGRSGSALITDGDTLLEAVSTLHWRGIRPRDPLIEVTSYQLFGRTMPLLHEATLAPSRGPCTASWLAKIPVPYARIRTRRVTVRCVGTNLRERRYLVPRAGSICAAVVWFAFAAFACIWLAPISRLLITAPLTAFGVLSGLWSSIGVHVLRVSQNKRSFRSLFFAWELAVLAAALATLLVIAVPPRVIVLVTNTTPGDVQLDNQRTIPPGASQQVFPVSVNGWKPSPPFCRCGGPSGCIGSKGCDKSLVVNGVNHLVIGCNDNDCTQIVEHVEAGGRATIDRPIETAAAPLSEIVFAAGATSCEMSLKAGDTVIAAKNVEQAEGATMTLRMLPPERPYSIRFDSLGTLQCDAKATHIVRIGLELSAAHADRIDVMLGAMSSKWVAVQGASELRACTDRVAEGAQALTLGTSDDKLVCRGGSIERAVSLEVTPAVSRFWLKIGDVESSWSSKNPSQFVHACMGKPGDVDLQPLRPGMSVRLPVAGAGSRVRVRRERGNPRSAVVVRCGAGDTVRAVRAGSVEDYQTTGAGPARVERLDATTGVTCETPGSLQDSLPTWHSRTDL